MSRLTSDLSPETYVVNLGTFSRSGGQSRSWSPNANAFTVGGRISGKTAKPVTAKPRKRRFKLKSKTFRVAAKRKTTVRLKMPRKLSLLLKRNGKLKLRLRANLRDPAGNTRTVTKTVRPRLKRERKRTAARTAGSGTIG